MPMTVLEHGDDELDILVKQLIREIDEYDAVQVSDNMKSNNKFNINDQFMKQDMGFDFPISPESLSPMSVYNDQAQQQQPIHDSYYKLLKFFSNLKTNYLKLCNLYNSLLLKLSDCEMDRSKLYEENLELKKLLKYMIDVNNNKNNDIQ